jgi:hypothetical protein
MAHLDSKIRRHHDAMMRTTVTLDKDVEKLLRDAMHRSRGSFKETLNRAIRAGLGRKLASPRKRPFVVKARPLHLRPGIDPATFNKLSDDLETDAFLERTNRRK